MSDKSTTFGGAVGRFFFAPTDPTTLGFMRILTGLLVLYTHLTYSLDLQAFFGPKAWWDHEIANRQRREVPIYVAPLGWDGFDPVIRVEDAPHRRVAVLEFLRKIPLEPADRVGKLRFLDTLLRRPGDEQVQALRLPNEAARLTDDQHKRVTAALASPTFNPADSPVTFPTFVLNLLPSERIAFWNDVLQFNTILPADSERLEYVLSWLTSYPNFPGPERRLLYQFLVGERKDAKGKDLSLPKDATTRDEYLKYLDFWAGDPRQYPALGLPIFSVWFHITNPATMWLVHTAFLVAFGLFTVGLFTRVTSVLTWFGTLCYIHHSQVTLFGQDTMQTILVFYLMIAPSGATLSLDALRKRFRAAKVLMAAGSRPVPWADAALAGPQPSWLANVMVRMFQIHFCVIYMSSGLSKLKGTTWWNHSAGWMTLVNPEFGPIRYQAYDFVLQVLVENRLLAAVVGASISVFTLIVEIGLPFLVWTRMRPVAVCGSILLHTGIAALMGLTVFSLYVFTLLLAYFPAKLIRERVGFPVGAGRKLTAMYDGRSPTSVRKAALIRALDVAHQVTFVDAATNGAVPDSTVRLTDAKGHIVTGRDLYETALSEMVLLRSIRLLGLIPGVWPLVRWWNGRT